MYCIFNAEIYCSKTPSCLFAVCNVRNVAFSPELCKKKVKEFILKRFSDSVLTTQFRSEKCIATLEIDKSPIHFNIRAKKKTVWESSLMLTQIRFQR